MTRAPQPVPHAHRASRRRVLRAGFATTLGLATAFAAQAEKRYDPGASDTEIKIGHSMPYSGPASAYGTAGKAEAAYFAKVNAEGGINGRKINFISVDDAFNPAQTMEQARKLVERDEVLVLFAVPGTANNLAIQRYMNAKKVPQLFISSGATRFGDPKAFPWTMGWQPTYQTEGRIYAQHVLATNPNAKVAVLSQNDDFGRDFLKGFVDTLGDKAKSMIVAQATYEVTDPSIDSQMISLKASGADTFLNITMARFATLSIRKAAEIGWKPVQYLCSPSVSVATVINPAGPENAMGLISAVYFRDPADPMWKGTKEYEDYKAWMTQYYPAGNVGDSLNVLGYSIAQTMEYVLRQAGDDLTRANIMKQAANMQFTPPMLYPGIEVKTTPTNFHPIERMQLVRFNGSRFEPFGKVLGD